MTKWISSLAETLILVMFVLALFQVGLPRYTTQGPSMEPTIFEGQRLISLATEAESLQLWSERSGGYLPEDIIIFAAAEDGADDIIKRGAAVGGDTIDIADGRVMVNGEVFRYEGEQPVHTSVGSLRYPYTVPPDSYFVLGDNRGNSNDSRRWGAIAHDRVQSRLLVVYWPPDDFRLY